MVSTTSIRNEKKNNKTKPREQVSNENSLPIRSLRAPDSLNSSRRSSNRTSTHLYSESWLDAAVFVWYVRNACLKRSKDCLLSSGVKWVWKCVRTCWTNWVTGSSDESDRCATRKRLVGRARSSLLARASFSADSLSGSVTVTEVCGKQREK